MPRIRAAVDQLSDYPNKGREAPANYFRALRDAAAWMPKNAILSAVILDLRADLCGILLRDGDDRRAVIARVFDPGEKRAAAPLEDLAAGYRKAAA